MLQYRICQDKKMGIFKNSGDFFKRFSMHIRMYIRRSTLHTLSIRFTLCVQSRTVSWFEKVNHSYLTAINTD